MEIKPFAGDLSDLTSGRLRLYSELCAVRDRLWERSFRLRNVGQRAAAQRWLDKARRLDAQIEKLGPV